MKGKKKKSNLLRKFLVIFASVLLIAGSFYVYEANKNNTVYAVGDLNIDWGVPDGDPIFIVAHMFPADVESRDVDVVNNAAVTRPVAVRGVKTFETLNFSTVLDFIILEGATPIYGAGSVTGAKTLADFFAESGDVNGIFLSNLGPTISTTYTFTVTFPESAGNEFQNASVIFDLIIGISVDVPEECSQIEFSQDPIFGTALGDSISGGPGNDLIFGLEGGDSINGNGGDDCIVGGDGGDSLRGNEGNDVIVGGEDGDSLKGNNGNDRLIGGNGSDSLNGGNGEDLLLGDEGHDSLEGDNNNDKLFGGNGDDSLSGGNGIDELYAQDGNDSLNGGNQDDTLIGGSGPFDSANGNAGTDTCEAEWETNCELDP